MRERMLKATMIVFLFAASVAAQQMSPEAGKFYNEGNAKLKAGAYGEAIDLYGQALGVEEHWMIYFQKGKAHQKKGQMEESLECYNSVVRLQPELDLAYLGRGGTFYRMGQMQKAIDDFKQVIELTDKNKRKEQAKGNIARAYAKLGSDAMANLDYNDAIGYFNQAIEYDDYDAAYLGLARAYSETGAWQNSINAAQKALDHRDRVSKGGPHYFMGLAYKNLGNNAKAKEHLRQASGDTQYGSVAKYELDTL